MEVPIDEQRYHQSEAGVTNGLSEEAQSVEDINHCRSEICNCIEYRKRLRDSGNNPDAGENPRIRMAELFDPL